MYNSMYNYLVVLLFISVISIKIATRVCYNLYCIIIYIRQLASQLSGLPREPPCYNSSVADNACPLKTKDILERLSIQYKLLPSWTLPSYR